MVYVSLVYLFVMQMCVVYVCTVGVCRVSVVSVVCVRSRSVYCLQACSAIYFPSFRYFATINREKSSAEPIVFVSVGIVKFRSLYSGISFNLSISRARLNFTELNIRGHYSTVFLRNSSRALMFIGRCRGVHDNQ